MIIKRYIVNNMNEAMTRIRYELGKDAVIISQRKIRKPGIFGFLSKKVVEVTAAVENVKKGEEDVLNSIDAIKKAMEKEVPSPSSQSNNLKTIEALKELMNDNKVKEHKEEKLVKEDNSSELIKEMQQMKNMISDMMVNAAENGPRKSKLQSKLENSDLNEVVIKKIIAKVNAMDEEISETEKLKTTIENMVSNSNAKMEGTVVLVGPTGVGKTTTIAKLAGRLSLIEKKKVGLITIDTYRIGAVEQLKTYADIMNLPFRVVITLKEMETAINSMSDCDIILIDTTGRSSKNTMQISELRAFIDRVNTTNIHLVLSATTKNKDAESIIEGFKILNYNNIIITKLDETSTYGSILNILDNAKKPLSFVTTGQNVPDDIKRLTASEISNLILGEDTVC